MKISTLNYSNLYNNNHYLKTEKTVCANNIEHSCLSFPSEIIGRSQVNFTAQNKFKLWENDEKFINVTAKELRLNEQETEQLHEIVEKHMANNNYKYLDDMITDNDFINENNQALFVDDICQQLGLSEWDYTIILRNLLVRLLNQKDYNPKAQKFIKDKGVVTEILDYYQVPKKQKNKIFSILENKAEENNCETVFDLYTNNVLDEDLKSELLDILGKEKYADVCIDFFNAGQCAKKGIKYAILNKHDDTEKYVNIVDQGIMANIAEKYNLDSNTDDMLPLIQLRKEGASPSEIAFRIAEKYELPGGAEASIIEIITENLKYEKEFLDAKNSGL